MKGCNEKMKILMFGMIMLIGIMQVNLISAETLVSDVGVEYESEILEEFNKMRNDETNQTFVKLIIYLKDISEAENLISNFNEAEVKNFLNRKTSSRIAVEMTEEGFYKLIQDDRVEKVYYDFPFYALEKNEFLNQIRFVYIGGVWAIIITAWIILVYILAKKIRRKKMSKGIHLIFLTLIILEILLFIFSSTFSTRSCGSPCDTHSLIDPFGYGSKGKECIAIAMCLPPAPHPLTFIMGDLLILTIFAYVILLMTNKIGLKNKK